jgi:hypothetical protein
MLTLLTAVISFYATPTYATSFYIRPFSEFTQSAANIVHARLSNVRTENALTADGGKTIYTYANAEIIEPIKGTFAGPNILIRKVGGTKDGMTLEIPSNVELSEGEEGVFFLSDIREDHAYEVTGMELGKYGVKEVNGEQILTGGIFNYSRPNPNDEHHDEAHLAPDLQENLHPWSIKELKELVKKQAAAAAVAPKITATPLPTASVSPGQSLPSPSNSTTAPISDENKPAAETANSFPLKWLFFGLAIAFAAFFFFRKK